MAELFRRHYASSLRVARRILTSPDDLLDAVQSAYLSAFRHFDSFRAESSFKTWITRIVVNQCLISLRDPARHRVWVHLDDAGPDGIPTLVVDRGPTPEEMARKTEISRTIAEATGHLPKGLREAFVLCAVSGHSIEEAAKMLGLSVAATKARLFRARAHLRGKLATVWQNEHAPRQQPCYS